MLNVHTLKVGLLGLSVSVVVARPHHNHETGKHGHTYLKLCADDSSVSSVACIHKVNNKWPEPARLDTNDCKEATCPFPPVGTNDNGCTASVPTKNLYVPITIPIGLKSPPTTYRHGADVDTFTDWDRLRCRDGQLFATGWYKKYTPQECARLCSKISDFYGKSCTHFSRQWILSDKPEHEDGCGRDGDDGFKDVPSACEAAPFGSYGSAGVGKGAYTHRGQCIFFSSTNDHCCATRAGWREVGAGTPSEDLDNNYCQATYGDRHDNWDNKHRSWQKKVAGFTPSGAWPVTSRGRRLGDSLPFGLDGEQPGVHELTFPNGSTLWAFEPFSDTNTSTVL